MVVTLQVIGYKNSGKTTVITAFIRELTRRHISVSVIKHSSHEIELDVAGTDTAQFTAAGAASTVLKTASTLYYQQPTTVQLTAADIMTGLPQKSAVVLIEGFKTDPFPKLALLKKPTDRQRLARYQPIVETASLFSPELLFQNESFGVSTITQWFIHEFLPKELTHDRFSHPF
ncbi:molybdopterin-guanine dinucleotide biosynthesis protein B [Lentilactobacillus farraginis]|uniref:Molybdopterin-guanine dinucleotide biosynthesis protein B (MobB) domain-containing protein n=3 Tax=Lentilactobacillus farraginis DSM 18382 = JCM 14108 TaxID=1423743 RepID=A0A0R1VVH4_9LACO|nr:molybdopterin-guanine dinucleotide biosynthesis protein B [Lentilactobacillus farraginis]KRM07444.1 hypothetical protein FD41_GL000401 [Lentilactobacillus farraginis DSM 18382 = JCM 14108]